MSNNKTTFRNLRDHLCSWGYATICEDCCKKETLPKNIDKNNIIKGFPYMDHCEFCGKDRN